MDDLRPVSVTIADRTYRIKVTAADEETVRKTVKFINEKISEFKGNFAGNDMQDYVAMVLIWFATQPNPTMQHQLSQSDALQELERMEQAVDKAMQATQG
ncbi:MAG: cell division protein ZapA [Bacteroidetes bacterium]|nr:MAG: cell division protein ZapA [Bacteroidota bacterium]